MRAAFGGISNVEIADEMKKTPSAITNYMDGRVTLPLVMEISKLTGCSVDWLLTGEGEKFITQEKQITLDEVFESKIRIIVQEELSKQLQKERGRPSLPLDLNNSDEDYKAA